MADIYGTEFVSLHVRKSNRAALSLYRDALGFTVKKVEKGYCAFFDFHLLAIPYLIFQTLMGRTLIRWNYRSNVHDYISHNHR